MPRKCKLAEINAGFFATHDRKNAFKIVFVGTHTLQTMHAWIFDGKIVP